MTNKGLKGHRRQCQSEDRVRLSINLPSKYSSILYHIQVMGHLRSLKWQRSIDCIRIPIVFHCNYGYISYHFRGEARYWSKITIFSYPLPHRTTWDLNWASGVTSKWPHRIHRDSFAPQKSPRFDHTNTQSIALRQPTQQAGIFFWKLALTRTPDPNWTTRLAISRCRCSVQVQCGSDAVRMQLRRYDWLPHGTVQCGNHS